MADTLSCQWETLHSQQLRSIKKSIDSDHGIFRDRAMSAMALSGHIEASSRMSSSPVCGPSNTVLRCVSYRIEVWEAHGGKTHRSEHCDETCRGCQGFLCRHSRIESGHGSRLDIDFRRHRGCCATDQHCDWGDQAPQCRISPSRWIISTRSISVFSPRHRQSNTVPNASRGG